jgi:hypothetical protein
MRDIPPPRQVTGPAFTHQVQRDLEDVKEILRASRLVTSPTVEVKENGDSIYLNALPGETAPSNTRNTWG